MKSIFIKFLFYLIAFSIGFGTMLLVALPALAILEPNVIILFGTGLIGFVYFRRRLRLG